MKRPSTKKKQVKKKAAGIRKATSKQAKVKATKSGNDQPISCSSPPCYLAEFEGLLLEDL